MTTTYPVQIDTNLTLPKVINHISPVRAEDVNRLQEAIIAIQKELGPNPSSTWGSLKERLENIFKEFNAFEVFYNNLDGYYVVDSDGYVSVQQALDQIGNTLRILSGNALVSASQVGIADLDGYFNSVNVEGALVEVIDKINTISSTSGVVIGAPEDGLYTDGLFADFVPTTAVGTAVDRFNEVLKNLAPSPAPNLTDIGWSSASGPSCKVSFDNTHPISGYTPVGTAAGGSALTINQTFATGGQRRGVFPSGTTHSGLLAGAVVAGSGSPTAAYPANSFGDANQGHLELWLNGSKVHDVDLSVFSSGSSMTGANGFTLSASTSVKFPGGQNFDIFKYRTGTWTVGSTNQINGHNYVQVIHRVFSMARASNFFEWIVDADVTTAIIALGNEVLDTLSMVAQSPTPRKISGVEYHVSGSAQYDFQIQNAYRNTYSTSASAISHPGKLNCTIADRFLPNMSAVGDSVVFANEAVTVANSATRILNQSIFVNTMIDKTVQTDITSTGQSISGILLDTVADDSTQEIETFNGEKYRLPSNRSMTITSGYLIGGNTAGTWDSSTAINSLNAGYSDGLLVYNGSLYYPSSSSVAASGNFASIANGPANNGQPGGMNPNYSTVSGQRVFLRYFMYTLPKANFILRINANGTVVAASVGPTTGTGQFSIQMCLPNTTTNDNTTFGAFKDPFVNYSNDLSAGIYGSTFGSNRGDLSGADWGISFGGKNTGTSGGVVVLKIIAPQGWTGFISNIQLIAA